MKILEILRGVVIFRLDVSENEITYGFGLEPLFFFHFPELFLPLDPDV